MKYLVLLILLSACQQNSAHKNDKVGKFTIIDEKLKKTATQLGVKIDTRVGGHSFDNTQVPREKLETRKILWIDGQIGKGIIIDQNFQNRNIDSPDWDFAILAWLNQSSPNEHGKPFWRKTLMEKVSLKSIEKNIDSLIRESLENLHTLKKTDLKYDQ